MRRRLAIIVNPVSGRRDNVSAATRTAECLDSLQCAVKTYITQHERHATQITRELEDTVEAVLVIGGDGTLNEVINGMVGRSIPILVWGRGTANVFGRNEAAPARPGAVARALQSWIPQRVDLGAVNGRYFHAMAGIGFDAACIKRLKRSGHLQYRDYFWPVWRSFWSYRPHPIDVRSDGHCIFSGPGTVLVGNQPYYGPGLHMFPAARTDDGKLDVCIIPAGSRVELFAQGARVASRNHVGRGGVIYCQSREIVVRASQEVHYHADGEWLGQGPCTFEVLPGAFEVLVPPGGADNKNGSPA